VSPKPSYREPSGTGTPLPPSSDTAQQQQGSGELESIGQAPGAAGQHSTAESRPQQLVDALYRALGVELGELTPALRARELAIAQQLVRVGATPEEAEAYAREAGSVDQRLAPIDLRSFERERPSWLARQRGSFARRRYVDRTGQGIDTQPHSPPIPDDVTRVPAPDVLSADWSSKSTADATSGDPADRRLSSPLAWTAALRQRLEGEQS
jgi:hypothetical protein